MWNPRQLLDIATELARLEVPSHDGGRLQTFDSLELPGAEVLRRLRQLLDGAGTTAVNAALLAGPTDPS